MKKISELIKYYESLKRDTDFEAYFTDINADRKIDVLKLMMEAVGDVSLPEEYFKAFMYELRMHSIWDTHLEDIDKVKTLYELCKDVEMKTEDLRDLILCYKRGPYTLLFDEFKSLAKSGNVGDRIYPLTKKAFELAEEEATKIDYLKGEYGPFIDEVKDTMVRYCLPVDRVYDVLPSKQFIDSSSVVIPRYTYPAITGEEIVINRLCSLEDEKAYQETPLDRKIKLRYSQYGDTIFTSFTKGEYEEDLSYVKKLRKK